MKQCLLRLAAIAAIALASQAHAQQVTEQSIVNDALARACDGHAGAVIPSSRLTQAMVAAARLNPLGDESPADMLDLVDRRANLLRGARALIQEQLATEGSSQAKALRVAPAPPPRAGPNPSNWLFGPTAFVLTCAPARPVVEPSFASIGPIVVRGSIDDLDEVGEARLSASAARVGWDRVRVTDLAGLTKETTTLVIDATIGIALPGSNTDRFGIAYADYSRSRVRTQTSASPTVSGSANDVDALELGFTGTIRPAPWLRATGRIGWTIDSVTDAQYLRGALNLVPITGGQPDLGICRLNMFRYIGLGVEARCTAAAEIDLRHVLRRGTAQLGAADMLVAIGGVVGAEFRRTLDINGNPQNGLVGSATYRYLRLIDGEGPDIDRFEASLSYRWWSGQLGFDLGFNYVDGIERKSLSDEHRLGIRFGIVY